MKGPYDDELEWPLRGTFTIELLNQINDENHYSNDVLFDRKLSEKSTERVLEGDKGEGLLIA